MHLPLKKANYKNLAPLIREGFYFDVIFILIHQKLPPVPNNLLYLSFSHYMPFLYRFLIKKRQMGLFHKSQLPKMCIYNRKSQIKFSSLILDIFEHEGISLNYYLLSRYPNKITPKFFFDMHYSWWDTIHIREFLPLIGPQKMVIQLIENICYDDNKFKMLFEAACRYGFNPKIHPIISNDSGDLLMRDFFSNYKLSQKEKYYNAEIFPDDHILDTFKLPLFGKESIKNNLLILQELYNMDPERYSP